MASQGDREGDPQLCPPDGRERGGGVSAAVIPVPVSLPITVGQFLKRAGIVWTGGEAKQLIGEGRVTVNSEIETHRGRKLAYGDVVEVDTTAVLAVVAFGEVEAAADASCGSGSCDTASSNLLE